MKRLNLKHEMDYQKRSMVNETLDQMEKRGILTEQVVREWLINQVEGLGKNGYIIIHKETLSYDDALAYYLELYGGC